MYTTDHNRMIDIAKVVSKEAMTRFRNIAKTTQFSTHSVLDTWTSQVREIII